MTCRREHANAVIRRCPPCDAELNEQGTRLEQGDSGRDYAGTRSAPHTDVEAAKCSGAMDAL
jgi:hypothetical protein